MDDFDWVLPALGALIIIGVVVFGVLQPKFEADTYTRLTGKKVTYWDAVWCDLRIQEQVK